MHRPDLRSSLPVVCLLLMVSSAVVAAEVTIDKGDGKLTVKIDGKLFTEYLFEGQNKPILYPVIGPRGVPMTRNFPMKPGVEGEAKDHPHHRSLWFTHGDVNGVDFWSEGARAGKQVQQELLEVSGGEKGVIRTSNRWVAPDGSVKCTDERKITFHVVGDARAIDYDITIRATDDKVVFGDTKEGTMGIRTHPSLRLRNDERRGVTSANGKARNSAGDRDRELWGKRASWVDYWGQIDGKTVGVAIFDHPSNPRHPTWWHARDYGLIAANAFGVHNFEGKPAGTGDMTIEAGKSVTFRYRFLFHEGDVEAAKIERAYAAYAGKKGD